MATRHIAGLILGPDATALAHGFGEGGLVHQRGGPEAVAVHLCHRVVEASDHVHEPGIGPSGG